MSDKEVINLSILKPKFHEAIRLRPFNLEAVKESLSAEELPGAVTIEKVAVKNTVSSGLLAAIIVCSVSVFVFLIVLGVYRLRRLVIYIFSLLILLIVSHLHIELGTGY